MTSRCCWFIQPASATRTNRSGDGNEGMAPRVPEAGHRLPGARSKIQPVAHKALGLASIGLLDNTALVGFRIGMSPSSRRRSGLCAAVPGVSDRRRRTVPVYVHDRDAVFSPAVDDALRAMNLRALKTPVRVPQANTFCERRIGTGWRECLDHCIPLNERHLRKILAEWVPHYDRGRPHASLGPGIPEPPALTVSRSAGHHIAQGHWVAAKPILSGLHHEYRLEPLAAQFSSEHTG